MQLAPLFCDLDNLSAIGKIAIKQTISAKSLFSIVIKQSPIGLDHMQRPQDYLFGQGHDNILWK